MLIVWAIGLVIVGHILLTRTQFGNWIFASGGDAEAARNSGVPVNRVKISMFMFSAFCATVFATCQVMEFGSAGADRGLLKDSIEELTLEPMQGVQGMRALRVSINFDALSNGQADKEGVSLEELLEGSADLSKDKE